MVNKPNINQLRPHFLFANVRQRWFAHLTPLHQFLFLFFLMDEGSGDETDLEDEPPKKKMRRTTSEVWCYFSKTDTGSECKICSNYIATHNTTQLWRHINNLHTQAHKYTTIWMALASYNTFFDAIDDQRALYPDNQNLIDAFTKWKKYYELTNDCPANFVATILCTKYKLDYFVKNGFDAELSYIKKTFDSFSFFFYVLMFF